MPYMAPYLMNHYLRKYLIKIWCFIDEIILLMLKLVSNKNDTYLTSLWRHERYLFSVFRGNLSAIFGRFSKKWSTSAVVHQKNIWPDYWNKYNTNTVKVFFWFHEVLNFLKNDGKMFKYSKRLDDVLIFEKKYLP